MLIKNLMSRETPRPYLKMPQFFPFFWTPFLKHIDCNICIDHVCHSGQDADKIKVVTPGARSTGWCVPGSTVSGSTNPDPI